MTIKTAQARSNSLARRAFYILVAVLGFLLVALTGLLSTAIYLSAGETNALSFSLPVLVIGSLVAGLLWRFGVWAQILAALLSLLILAFMVPFSTFNLLHPEDASDFIPIVLMIAGALLGFVGSIVSLIQRLRKAVHPVGTRTELLALRILLAALGLVVLTSLVLTTASRTTLSAQAKSSAIAIEIKDYQFNPDRLIVKAGDTVRIAVKNNDPTLHTFTLNEAGVDVSIPPGAERLIEFQAPPPGKYIWYCIPHSDDSSEGRTGMVGSLTVQ